MDSNPSNTSDRKAEVNYEKRFKFKKKVILPIIIFTFLIVIGATMTNTVMARIAPNKFVLLSMNKMQKLSKKKTKSSTYQIPENNKVSFNFNLKRIDGINNYMTKVLEGGGISFSLANSQQGDIIINTSINQSETSLAEFSIYSTPNRLGVKIPEVANKYIMIDLNDFRDKFNLSDISSYWGNIDEYDMDMFNMAIKNMRKTVQNDNTLDEFSNEIKYAYVDLFNDTKVKYNGTTKTKIGNKQKNAHKFLINVDSSNVQNFVKTVTKSISTHYKPYNLLNITNSSFDITKLEKLKYSDAEINLIIDNKKNIVGLELYNKVSGDYDDFKITLDYNLSGNVNIYDTLDANLKLESDYDTILFSLDSNKTYENKNSKTSQDTYFNIKSDDGNLISGNVNIDKDLKSKDDNFILSAKLDSYDDQSLNFKLSGNLDNSKDNFNFDISKVEIKSKDYWDDITIVGSAYLGLENLNNEDISIPESNQLDFFTIDSYQFLDIIMELQANFYNLDSMFIN